MKKKFESGEEAAAILARMVSVEQAKRKTLALLSELRRDLVTEKIAQEDRENIEDYFNRINATLGVILQEHVRDRLECSSDDQLAEETITI